MSSALSRAVNKAAIERVEKLKAIDDDPFIGYDSIDDAINDCRASSQVEVMARLLNRENLFISGPAGSGKSTIIKRFIDLIDAEFEGRFNVAVTASTGLAATLIDGSTIHSWSGLGIYDKKFDPKNKDVKLFNVWSKIKYTDVLIIDEISMLHAYYLDNIDTLCKYVRRSQKPFGGIQVVFLGDFLQLPPVEPREPIEGMNYGFAITSDAWKNADITTCYLDKTHRASDKYLKYLLTTIANNKVNEKSHRIVRKCESNVRNPNKVYTTLFTTNKNVDTYNTNELNKNPNPQRVYTYKRTFGSKDKVEKLLRERNIPEQVTLKREATVIITSNIHNPISGNLDATNGSVGKITSMTNDVITVLLNTGNVLNLGRMVYSATKKSSVTGVDGKVIEADEVTATVEQFPIKLGYAITVHKSQGQTFDAVEVDLSKCFTPGLGYVALSRVRSIDDLIVTNMSDNALVVDPKSLKISMFVKRSALKNRQEFIDHKDLYSNLLLMSAARLIMWDDSQSGSMRKAYDDARKA